MFSRFSALLSLVCAASASAGGISLTPDAAAGYALKHNLTIAAARLRIEEARGRLVQSGRLANPELEFDFDRNTMGREGSVGLSLMQRFPLTARLRHEKSVSRAELAAAEAEVNDGERKLVADVRQAAVKLLALHSQRGLRHQQLENSRELSKFLLARVETGEASAVDASQVELETRQIEVETLQLATEEVSLVSQLRPLLGLAADTSITIDGSLPAPGRLPHSTGAGG